MPTTTATSARDALAHALLTRDEEVELAKRIEAGLIAEQTLTTTPPHIDATPEELRWLVEDGREARETLITSNLRLAISEIRKFRNRGYSDEDLIQDAYVGLCNAVERFDHAKGFRFSTFAVWYIREALHTGIRDNGFVRYPERLFNNLIKVRAVKMRLSDELGRNPTAEEIAAFAEMSLRDVVRCLGVDVPITSLDTPVADDMQFGDLICDSDAEVVLSGVEEDVDRSRLATLVGSYLKDVPAKELAILVARYGLDGRAPRNITQVAGEFGLSRQTVRTYERAAMTRLRTPEAMTRLCAFLPSN